VVDFVCINRAKSKKKKKKNSHLFLQELGGFIPFSLLSRQVLRRRCGPCTLAPKKIYLFFFVHFAGFFVIRGITDGESKYRQSPKQQNRMTD